MLVLIDGVQYLDKIKLTLHFFITASAQITVQCFLTEYNFALISHVSYDIGNV